MGGTCDFEVRNLTRIWAKIEKEKEKTRHNGEPYPQANMLCQDRGCVNYDRVVVVPQGLVAQDPTR